MNAKKTSVKFNFFYIMTLASLLFICGFIFLPQNNTYAETKWTDIVTTPDINAFKNLGAGTSEENPYKISTASQLATMSYLVNNNSSNGTLNYRVAYYKLNNNIDLSQYEWNPIGTKSDRLDRLDRPFMGNFDGGGYVISGMKIGVGSNVIYAGLFGYANNATIKNLSVIGSNTTITAYSASSNVYAGGIVAYATGTTLSNISNLGINVYAFSNDTAGAGGIVGFSYLCTLNNLSNYADVVTYVKNDTANRVIYAYSGGIAGITYGASSRISYTRNNGKIQSYADGTRITAVDHTTGTAIKSPSAKPNTFSGGIVGQANTPISESFNSGEIISGDSTSFVLNSVSYSNELPNISYAGGIAGKSTNTITNTFNTGSVTASAFQNTTTHNNIYLGTASVYKSSELDNHYNILLDGKWYRVYVECSRDRCKLLTSITEYAYSGGIVGYTINNVSNSYNDGMISGGGITNNIQETFYISIIKKQEWKINYFAFGVVSEDYNYWYEQIIFDFITTYNENLYYGSINGNRDAATTNSYGSHNFMNLEQKIVMNATRVSRTVKRRGEASPDILVGGNVYRILYNDTTNTSSRTNLVSDTKTSSQKISIIPSTNYINHNIYDDSRYYNYVKNIKFTSQIKRDGNNVSRIMLMTYDEYGRHKRNNYGAFTDSDRTYVLSNVMSGNNLFFSHNLNHTVKSATTITAANLGSSTIWAKTSNVNGNRPYIKDFYW